MLDAGADTVELVIIKRKVPKLSQLAPWRAAAILRDIKMITADNLGKLSKARGVAEAYHVTCYLSAKVVRGAAAASK